MSDNPTSKRSSTFTELERRYDLDWFRVITIFLVFIYHCTKFFDADPINIKNDPLNFVEPFSIPIANHKLSANTSFLTAIGLPLFFIIAGMSMFYALGYMEKREIKLRKYVLLRFVRLIIPYLIGMFTYVSVLVYLEWTNKELISLSFAQFYPRYFDGIYGFDGGAFSVFGHHLWFLVILFIFSLITVNLFSHLRKDKYRTGFAKFASFFTKPGTIYLFIIPVYLMEIVHSLFLYEIPRFGGWDFFTYIFYLFFGYILAYDQQFRKAVKKNRIIALSAGVLSTIALILMNHYYFDEIWLTLGLTTVKIPFLLARVIFAWSWLIVILYLGNKYLNKESKAVKKLNELVLPFYIIHFVVLGIVGFYVVQFEFLVISELLIIFIISLAAIVILLLIIREFNLFRFIFGMSVTKKKSISRFFKKNKGEN